MAVDAQAEGRGMRITRSLGVSHPRHHPFVPHPLSLSLLSLFPSSPPIIEVKLIRKSWVRDTYGSAPSDGLIRGTITKIPSSRFHPCRRRGCCWNRGHLFDAVLGGSRLENNRFFECWSCRG